MPDPQLVAQGQERRAQIVEFVVKYRAEHHMSPSIAEIAEALGIWPSAVRRHVQVLIDEGRLRQNTGQVRTLRPTKPAKRRTSRKKAS